MIEEYIKKCRELAKQHLDRADGIEDDDEFDRFWEKVPPPFPIEFPKNKDNCWDLTIEYCVSDFLAEFGFFAFLMGIDVKGYDKGYAMFKSPGNDVFFSIWEENKSSTATPPDCLRLVFWMKNPVEATKVLKERGVIFDVEPKPVAEGATFFQGHLRTPNGILVQLWGDSSMK